jgi:hypothetical protein
MNEPCFAAQWFGCPAMNGHYSAAQWFLCCTVSVLVPSEFEPLPLLLLHCC